MIGTIIYYIAAVGAGLANMGFRFCSSGGFSTIWKYYDSKLLVTRQKVFLYMNKHAALLPALEFPKAELVSSKNETHKID